MYAGEGMYTREDACPGEDNTYAGEEDTYAGEDAYAREDTFTGEDAHSKEIIHTARAALSKLLSAFRLIQTSAILKKNKKKKGAGLLMSKRTKTRLSK